MILNLAMNGQFSTFAILVEDFNVFTESSFNTFSESYSVSCHSEEIEERITAGI